ncbi:MAG: hypothetical protein P4L75_00100 [Clostridia bacterium]|nr:hypothetical protein [Clostridia bacterium]MDR3643864.1 hypothetical protein [Clostridia bacterium]
MALYVGYNSTVLVGAGYWVNAAGVNQVEYARTKKSYRGSVFYSYSKLGQIGQAQLFKGIYD